MVSHGDRVKRSAGSSMLSSLDNLPRVLRDISELRHRVQDSINAYVCLSHFPESIIAVCS